MDRVNSPPSDNCIRVLKFSQHHLHVFERTGKEKTEILEASRVTSRPTNRENKKRFMTLESRLPRTDLETFLSHLKKETQKHMLK